MLCAQCGQSHYVYAAWNPKRIQGEGQLIAQSHAAMYRQDLMNEVEGDGSE